MRRSVEQVGKELPFKITKSEVPRRFPLPQMLLNALLKHRTERNRNMFGPDYNVADNLVIADPDESLVAPDSFNAAYARTFGRSGSADTASTPSGITTPPCCWRKASPSRQ